MKLFKKFSYTSKKNRAFRLKSPEIPEDIDYPTYIHIIAFNFRKSWRKNIAQRKVDERHDKVSCCCEEQSALICDRSSCQRHRVTLTLIVVNHTLLTRCGHYDLQRMLPQTIHLSTINFSIWKHHVSVPIHP